MAKGKKNKKDKKSKKNKKKLLTAKKKIREEIFEESGQEICQEVGEKSQEIGEEIGEEIRQKIQGGRAEKIGEEGQRQEGQRQEEPCEKDGSSGRGCQTSMHQNLRQRRSAAPKPAPAPSQLQGRPPRPPHRHRAGRLQVLLHPVLLHQVQLHQAPLYPVPRRRGDIRPPVKATTNTNSGARSGYRGSCFGPQRPSLRPFLCRLAGWSLALAKVNRFDGHFGRHRQRMLWQVGARLYHPTKMSLNRHRDQLKLLSECNTRRQHFAEMAVTPKKSADACLFCFPQRAARSRLRSR